jgi:hypothetical protein
LLAQASRLADLRAAQIVNLPSPRRRNWRWFWAVASVGMAAGWAMLAVSEKPLDGIVAVVCAISALGWAFDARTMTAQLRSPQRASYESFDEPTDVQEAGGTALEGAMSVALSGVGGGLIETALGVAVGPAEKLWRFGARGRTARWQAAVAADLHDGERPLVGCRALLVPHGARRVLLFLTFGLVSKRGFVTVTNERLLFHGRRRHRLRVSARLAELELLEWFEGVLYEARTRVLIVRAPDGRIVRLNINRTWAEEAQSVFDLVASSSQRLPPFLAARWTPDGDRIPA